MNSLKNCSQCSLRSLLTNSRLVFLALHNVLSRNMSRQSFSNMSMNVCSKYCWQSIIYLHCNATNSSTYEYNVARLCDSSRDEQTSAVPVDQSHHCEVTKPHAAYCDADEHSTDDTDLTGRGQILRVPTTGDNIITSPSRD